MTSIEIQAEIQRLTEMKKKQQSLEQHKHKIWQMSALLVSLSLFEKSAEFHPIKPGET